MVADATSVEVERVAQHAERDALEERVHVQAIEPGRVLDRTRLDRRRGGRPTGDSKQYGIDARRAPAHDNGRQGDAYPMNRAATEAARRHMLPMHANRIADCLRRTAFAGPHPTPLSCL